MLIDVYCAQRSGERVEEHARVEEEREEERHGARPRLAPSATPCHASADDLGAASVSDVLSELQSAFSTADAELEQAITRVSGMKEDDASLSAAGAPSESAEWQSVNRMLQHHGFAPLAMRRTEDEGGAPTFSPAPDSIRDAFTKICEAYERQQTSLQRALEEAAVADRATQSAKVSVQASADEELQRANASLEAQLEMARGRLQSRRRRRKAAATAEKALGGLRQKISQQSHAMKKNEAETQRLQERLAKELTERDSAQKARERQVFQEVHKRAARPSSAADSRSLEVISVYEAQRRTMQAELDDLRAHSTSLAAELAQKENLIQRKDAFRSWRTPDRGRDAGKAEGGAGE